MIRKSLTILSLIGLLLSVVSYLSMIYIPLSPTSKAVIGGGVISTYWISRWAPCRPPRSQRGYPEINAAILVDYETFSPGLAFGAPRLLLPFGWLPELEAKQTQRGRISISRIPLYPPIWGSAATILFILWTVPAHRRRKRKKLGLCLNCGYDLRGSKDICPECGEAIP